MTLRDALPKVRLLIPRLASDSDGEVVATVNAIRRLLKTNNSDLHDLASALGDASKANTGYNHSNSREEKPKTGGHSKWDEVILFCMENDEWLSEREKTFVSDMEENIKKWGSPTEKQGKWLMSIFSKLGGKQ